MTETDFREVGTWQRSSPISPSLCLFLCRTGAARHGTGLRYQLSTRRAGVANYRPPDVPCPTLSAAARRQGPRPQGLRRPVVRAGPAGPSPARTAPQVAGGQASRAVVPRGRAGPHGPGSRAGTPPARPLLLKRSGWSKWRKKDGSPRGERPDHAGRRGRVRARRIAPETEAVSVPGPLPGPRRKSKRRGRQAPSCQGLQVVHGHRRTCCRWRSAFSCACRNQSR
jgi:hypothetical protein